MVTELYRPVVGNQILRISTQCPINTSGSERTKEQVHQLVAHELVLYEEGEDEVVIGTIRIPITTSMDIRNMGAKRLGAQGRSCGSGLSQRMRVGRSIPIT